MSENPDSVPSPAQDPRPRPQFGELAPEGWTWQPPEEPKEDDRVAPAPATAAGGGAAASSPATPGVPPAAQPRGQRSVPRWDRPWTVGLLTLGLLFTLYGAFSLGALADNMQQIYTQMGVGTYTPPAGIRTLTTVGAILLVFVWLAATATSVRLLFRRRRAFYVPLIGGVLSIVVLFGFMIAAMLSDPTLIEFLSRP